jgi:hypothetical protein
MRTRDSLVPLALSALILLFGVPARADSPDRGAADAPRAEARPDADPDFPTNRPIVATVVEVDEDAGRVTLDTAHGQVALSVSQELAERLSPGDVVVLRLTDDDEDFPSASPREESPKTEAPAKI